MRCMELTLVEVEADQPPAANVFQLNVRIGTAGHNAITKQLMTGGAAMVPHLDEADGRVRDTLVKSFTSNQSQNSNPSPRDGSRC